MPLNAIPEGPGTTGPFNYLDQSVEHSLYRNGKVLTRRDRDGSDAGTEGMLTDKREMAVADARRLSDAERCTLDANGFELLTQPMARPNLDFFDQQQVLQEYYPECERIVQQAAGATRAFAFDHNIRSATGKKSKQRISGGQQVQGPARIVHGDYTLTSAPQRLRDLAQPPGGNDTLRSLLGDNEALLPAERVEQALDQGRFAIINLWRSIVPEPVATLPLALCDAQTVHPQDLVVFEIHYHDRVGENYFAKYDPRQRWYYYPNMTRDEALLIKQWDSAGELASSQGAHADINTDKPCTFSFHSAFEDAAAPADAPDRQSIEVRCIVFYDSPNQHS